MKKKTWIWIGAGVVVVIIAAALIFRPRQTAGAQSELQTIEVQIGELTATIGGTGTLRANQTATLAWETSGDVANVYVKVGDVVSKGLELADLDPLSLSQSVIMAKADLVSAQQNLEDLQNSAVATAKAQMTLAQAQSELEDATQDRTSKDYQRASDATVDGLKADLIMAERALEDAQGFYDGVAAMPENDPVRAQALSNLSAAKKARDRAQYNLEYALGMPDTNEVAEADARVALAQANYDEALREWERLKDGSDPDDIAAAQARVDALLATIGAADLEAPFDGTVTLVDIIAGDQANPGSAVFRIDDLTRLLTEVQIPEVDINQVQVGQPATLTFDAVPEVEYHGVVVEVAQVGSVTATGVDFTVTIELTDADAAIKPGMTAAVNIVTTQLEEVLLVPNRAVRTQDGERIVWVLENGIPVSRSIKLGSSSDTYSQVLSGLDAGELVIMNPSDEMTSMPRPGMIMRGRP